MRLKYRIKDCFYKIIYLVQKITRFKHHCSNGDLINLDYHLAKIIYYKLKAFKKTNTSSYPIYFKDKGGYKEWMNILDKMMFSFEFILVDKGYNKKLYKGFKEKYGDWNEESLKNKKEIKWYRNKITGEKIISNREDIDIDKWEYDHSDFVYYNSGLYFELSKKCDEGLELFSKYFRNLWR